MLTRNMSQRVGLVGSDTEITASGGDDGKEKCEVSEVESHILVEIC